MVQSIAPTLLASFVASDMPAADKLEVPPALARAAAASPPQPSYAFRWAQAVETYGDLDALVFDGVGPELRFTFKNLEANANRLARNLVDLGVQTGDRVVTIAENRPELAVLLLSCLKLGVSFVPLATDLRVQDIHTMVDVYEPKLIVCDQPQYAPFQLADGGERQALVLPPFRAGDNELKRMMAEGDDAPIDPPSLSPGDTSIIFSTSGSTGVPKGVMYSFDDVAGLGAEGSLGPDLASTTMQSSRTKMLLWVSMRGVCGTTFLLRELVRGSMTVMVDAYPGGPQLWGDLMDKHQINYHILFGAAMNQTLQEMPERKFGYMQKIMYGGSCFAPSLIQRSMGQFPNAAFVQGYGMTETFPISTLASKYHKLSGEASPEDMVRMTSAGKPVVRENVFIEDLDQPGSGKPPPPEKEGVGQICARSSITMTGYFGNPEKTQETMPDGKFVRTGDVGKIDEDGFLYILGRVKDIIPAYKGFNVCPRDIEEVLYTHPGVGQAAIVGIWHPSGVGEAVVAWVSPKAGSRLIPDELRVHCREAGLPTWQMPDAIYVCDQPLPANGGKIANKTLRTPEFRQRALVELIVLAEKRLQQSSDQASGLEPACSSEDEALVNQIIGDEDSMSMVKLEALFGDCLPSALQALCPHSVDSAEPLERAALLQLFTAMFAEEKAAFVLGASSLLGSWAASKLA